MFGLIRILTFDALKVCYVIAIFQPMKIYVSKTMKVQFCENETTVFIGFYSDNQVTLKLYEKYKSVRLYLHWLNVPTLTLI